jgi:RNA polymerase sigma-70 factor, ECF subfamily
MIFTHKQIEFERQLDLTNLRQFRKTGDLSYLEDAYDKYLPLVYGVAYKCIQNRSKAQQLVIKVFDKLTVDALSNDIHCLRSWIYKAIKGYCVD